jgi:hypothetical protein
MCTMSVIRLPGDALRVAFNRDELLSRPRALPPQRFSLGDRDILYPIDPQSLGTWIALNDCGLILGLLNLNLPAAKPKPGTISRGCMIPMFSRAVSVIEAAEMMDAASFSDFSPFRVIAIDQSNLAEIIFDGDRQRIAFHPNWEAEMFTSSGLGDHVVEPPRRELFDRLLERHGATPAAQDLFHDHVWPNAQHLSVHMSRPGARTVSQTLIEMDRHRAVMSYSDGYVYREQAELTLWQAVRA